MHCLLMSPTMLSPKLTCSLFETSTPSIPAPIIISFLWLSLEQLVYGHHHLDSPSPLLHLSRQKLQQHHHLFCFCSPLLLLLPLFSIASACSCSCCLQATIATVITITIIVLHQLFSLPCCCHGAKVATLMIIVAITVLLVLTLLLSTSSSIGQLHLMPSLLPWMEHSLAQTFPRPASFGFKLGEQVSLLKCWFLVVV